jgi:apolipoprotein D and lipocalin family protein
MLDLAQLAREVSLMRPLLFSLPGVLALTGGCASDSRPPLQVVDHVELERYVGRWYEIARYPAWFQKGCVATTAEYSIRPDGKIRVVNRCRQDSLEGRERKAEAVARVVDPRTNAKLKVSFFWPFEGDYWVIDLDDDYRWAVVGEPRRKYLWILSRTPTMEEAVYGDIVGRLQEQHYDPSRLQRTLQVTAEGT